MQTTTVHARSRSRSAHREIVVVSVPAAHPYVRQVTATSGIRVLADVVADGPAGRWWPPAALDPAWIAAHADSADLLHVHFGTESFAPGHLTACIRAAHDAGWPVVFTVHDLEHPQLGSQDAYAAQLDELVAGTDALITLTPGAAAAVRERWGRDAAVLPHPAILPAEAVVPSVRTTGEVRVGTHLKDLRPNVDGPGTVRALAAAVERLRADGLTAVGEVRMHHRVRDERVRDEVRELCERSGTIALLEHERLSDAELLVALSRLDACMLPYRHGTHSGWLELCWDLAVPVAAPAVGCYGQQHRDGSVAVFAAGDGDALGAAVARLLHAPDSTRAATPERVAAIARRRDIRRRTDTAVAAAHESLYRRLLGSGA